LPARSTPPKEALEAIEHAGNRDALPRGAERGEVDEAIDNPAKNTGGVSQPLNRLANIRGLARASAQTFDIEEHRGKWISDIVGDVGDKRADRLGALLVEALNQIFSTG
jgi:hypothetical protein